jgi:hypothetical protein
LSQPQLGPALRLFGISRFAKGTPQAFGSTPATDQNDPHPGIGMHQLNL